jgi:hypothetical protein
MATTNAYAQVHLVDIDMCKEAEKRIDISKYKTHEHWYCDPKILKPLREEYARHYTDLVLDKYPNLPNTARHGDVLQDNTAGYRSSGVYFIRTRPSFCVIDKGTELDMYGNVPEEFPVFSEFDVHHWALDKMTTVDHTHENEDEKATEFDFYWHGDNHPWVHINEGVKEDGVWAEDQDGTWRFTYKGFIYTFEDNEDQEVFPDAANPSYVTKESVGSAEKSMKRSSSLLPDNTTIPMCSVCKKRKITE